MNLTEFCQRLTGPDGSKAREAMKTEARKAGERAFLNEITDPDDATLEFADIVHKRLGVPQSDDFCYSFLDLPEFEDIKRAVDFFEEEYNFGMYLACETW